MAGMIETPIVCVDVQRAGPATGVVLVVSDARAENIHQREARLNGALSISTMCFCLPLNARATYVHSQRLPSDVDGFSTLPCASLGFHSLTLVATLAGRP